MATVGEFFPNIKRLEIDITQLNSLVIDPENVWVNYNADADMMTVFFAKEPVRNRAIPINDVFNLLIDPKTKQIVGLMFEAWELKMVPAYKATNSAWPEMRPKLVEGWSYALQMLILWVVTLIKLHPESNGLVVQPA